MPKEYKNILIICVDRDDDLGKKADIEGPIVGRKENLNAAAKLALADPEESDANCIFGAIKKYDEIKKKYPNTEIVTLTGASKLGFDSDRKINSQLDEVLEKFKPDGFVLVTDGAEDDQVIPILQSRAPIISKETILVKQAKEVESTYYTIKEVLKDPEIARIVFLIPGIIILIWGVLYFLNSERFFYQAISFIVGIYLIMKGSGLEEIIASNIKNVVSSFSLQRVSFPFYIFSIALIIFLVYNTYFIIIKPPYSKIEDNLIYASEQSLLLLSISSISFIFGKAIDSVQLKKAIFLRTYFLYSTAIIILWYFLDGSVKVIAGEEYADLNWLMLRVIICFISSLLAFKISTWLDISKRVTKILVGLPVYDKEGRLIGKVEEIDKNKKIIKYLNYKTKEKIEIKEGLFILKKGKIFV
ncbi:MAG: DUF373 family protein [Candidatus Diapherotrites archaeon]|nr:DUF373 family protein [Candidatus Diapherotrites archaeon]